MNNLKAAIDGLEALKTHYDIQGPGAEAGTVYHLFVASIDTALATLRDAQDRSYCHKCGRALNEPDGNADKLATVSKTERVEEEP